MTSEIVNERGLFWWDDEPVPQGQFAPQNSVTGVLKIASDGDIDLEPDLPMPGRSAWQVLEHREIPQDTEIHGLLRASNQNVVLMDLYPRPGIFKSNGISNDRYGAQIALVGGAPTIGIKRPLSICRMIVELKGFDVWLRLGNIKSNRSESSCVVQYEKPTDLHYRLEEGTLSIRFSLSGVLSGQWRSDDLHLSECASIVYVPDRHRTLQEVREQYAHLGDLFLLLTGSTYQLGWPTVVPEGDGTHFKLYYPRPSGATEPPSRMDCCTNLPRLRESFGNIFRRYRTKREELGPGIFLYLGTQRASEMYVEHRFISFVTGLESLHRRQGPDVDANLTEKIERILAQIPEKGDRRWLEWKLKNATEPSLRDRLSQNLSVLPLEKDSLNVFCDTCADRRNDISHFGGQRTLGTGYASFLNDLVVKNRALSHLYHLILLREIGLDEKTVEEIALWFPGKDALVRAGLKLTLNDPSDTSHDLLAPVPAQPPASPTADSG